MQQPPRSQVSAEVLDLLLGEAVRCFGEQHASGSASHAAALEAVGMQAGRQLAERMTRDRPRLGDSLEVIKFVCKDFWSAVFKKPVDNLRTNNRGVYVLQDNAFRWLQRFALPAGPPSAGPGQQQQQDEELRALAASHLHLPRGIVRGALCQLGVACTVEAELKQLPACAFTVRMA